jgi:hypothetical protein
MWRWLVPYGLTAVPVTIILFAWQVYLPMTDMFPRTDAYRPGSVTFAWLLLMAIASPTILYYRLLIFAGERGVPRRPLAGAAVLLMIGAIAPPLVRNGLADRASAARDFVGPAPGRADIVAIDQPDRNRDRRLECRYACIRLLFGGGARQIVLAEAATGRTAPTLRLERRTTCPPVDRRTSATADPGLPALTLNGSDRALESRALALIASGQCLVVAPGRLDSATLRLGSRWMLQPDSVPVPNGFGLDNGIYSIVDRRDGERWTRLSQRMEASGSRRWLYPFAFMPVRRGWIAGLEAGRYVPSEARPETQPWAWAGVILPDLPDTGWQRVREMLQAALALPPGAPRDARHQLARQYLAGLASRPADAVDRDLLRRLPADPRIEKDDLADLDRVSALARGDPPGPAPSYGARPAWGEDLGVLGTRQYFAFALDIAVLLGLHLAALAIWRRRRARKRLQDSDVPVQATP